MQWKNPKNTDKYEWTAHVSEKMHFYGLSEQKVLGVIRNPKRIETGIAQNTVAVMNPVGNIQKGAVKPRWGRPVFAEASPRQLSSSEESWNQEIWVMYQTSGQKKMAIDKDKFKDKPELKKLQAKINSKSKLTIISAWRFPGISPKKNPIPEEIMREIEEII